jgi:hypothetical protein
MKVTLKKISKLSLCLGLAASLSLLPACGPNSDEQANVALTMSGYTTAQNKIINFFIPSAHAAVGSLKFCFKRLRFKRNIPDDQQPVAGEDNVDFFLGEKIIDAAGTSLGQISIPTGEYKRIEFDLEPECAGLSVDLSNSNGSYTSTERITLKFEGLFTVEGDAEINLNVQTILDGLNSYNGSVSLRDAIEGISGSI